MVELWTDDLCRTAAERVWRGVERLNMYVPTCGALGVLSGARYLVPKLVHPEFCTHQMTADHGKIHVEL